MKKHAVNRVVLIALHVALGDVLLVSTSCAGGGSSTEQMVVTGQTSPDGTARLSAGTQEATIKVSNEQGNPLSGISLVFRAKGDSRNAVVAYDPSGAYMPTMDWDLPAADRRAQSLSPVRSPLVVTATLVMVASAVATGGLLKTIFDQAREPPLALECGDDAICFCGSREYFIREGDIASGVVLLGAARIVGGIVEVVSSVVDVADALSIMAGGRLSIGSGQLAGQGLLAALDSHFGKVQHPGYLVRVPQSKPRCQGGSDVVQDLCIYGDATTGLAVWNTLPLMIEVLAPCDPEGLGKPGGGPPGEGIWTDPSTGIEWQAVPVDTDMTWNEAMNYCEDLSLAGSSAWRLPTIDELRSLVRSCPAIGTGGPCGITDSCNYAECDECSASGGCMCSPAKNGCGAQHVPAQGCYWPADMMGSCGSYWSGTSSRYYDAVAYSVDYAYGALSGLNKTQYPVHVRCVKN